MLKGKPAICSLAPKNMRGPLVPLVSAVLCVVLWMLWQTASLLSYPDAGARAADGGKAPKRHFLGICSSFKDDARWLVEWVEFHRAAGVDHVYAINDGSADETAAVLAYYQAQGFVTVVDGTVPENGDARCLLQSARDSAYVAMCYDHAAPHLDWMIIMDSDEFVFPRVGCSVSSYIREVCNPAASHIILQWEMFGSSGLSLHPPGLLTENFLTSGGDCSPYVDQWGPACKPFAGNCKECRHTKYAANTASCLRSAVHCHNHLPARLRLANSSCDIVPDSTAACTRWYETGYRGLAGGESGEVLSPFEKLFGARNESVAAKARGRPAAFGADCCSAGLGFHHYSPKSEEARRWRSKRRMRNGLGDNRDATPGAERRDLNWVLSFAAAKYLATVRSRAVAATRALWPDSLASGVSPAVAMLPAATGGMCFTERGFSYAPRGVQSEWPMTQYHVGSLQDCCDLCAATGGPALACFSFTYRPSHSVCVMHVRRLAAANWPPTSIPATRKMADGYISGAYLHERPC
ncbi:hypothetical protein DIPPA_05521 [Diplonema papillatum]|nr:hypothetical protein DIPPA_31285 [Diplonema papillatum]KAJ9463989.1 hypothetical protein DIPPA_05521 [Diplonema papillatum]